MISNLRDVKCSSVQTLRRICHPFGSHKARGINLCSCVQRISGVCKEKFSFAIRESSGTGTGWMISMFPLSTPVFQNWEKPESKLNQFKFFPSKSGDSDEYSWIQILLYCHAYFSHNLFFHFLDCIKLFIKHQF
jgi:hypothetical protein